MLNDLNTTKSALTKLHQDMEAINRLAKPPSYLSMTEQMERTMESIHRYQLKINRTLVLSGVAPRIKEILDANQHLQDVIKQPTASSRIVESLNATPQSWLDHLKPLQKKFSQLSQPQAPAKLALRDVSLQLAATKQLMAGIDFEAMRSRFHIETPVISGLESTIARVAASYWSLAESVRNISDITRLPAFILPGATREIYTTSFALETLRPRDEGDEEDAETEIQFVAEAELETSCCITLLQQVDPGLVQLYVGARDALDGNNADRVRHILISLRELWKHLLERLASDDLVVAWIQETSNQKDLLHEGKPTWRSRVMYVCRELNNDPLDKFLIHDTRALVKLINFFNLIHELETKLSDKQLRAILLKTDSWLMYILQISAGDFHK